MAACSGSDTASRLRQVEAAIAQGDMKAAHSVADKILGQGSIETLDAVDLARLSVVYMRMADEEADNTALVATAADLYRRACQANADSAEAYYSSLSPDDEALAVQLFHIVAATDSAGVIPPDGQPLDSLAE